MKGLKIMADVNVSETNTENLFRENYGATKFIEKSAIPKKFGFLTKENIGKTPDDPTWSNKDGYPDFFKDCGEYIVIVEAKGIDHDVAEEQLVYYMTVNKIIVPIIGIAISGQTMAGLKATYYYKNGLVVKKLTPKYGLLPLDKINELYKTETFGDTISDEDLTTILNELNNTFHDNGVRDTDRSLFFSALMIALTNKNFRANYNNQVSALDDADENEKSNGIVVECKNLNELILDSVKKQLVGKINNLSKEISWGARFSFIENIDIPLDKYKEIIETIETKIFVPFKHKEKQDILGRAYKAFLKRSGKVDNKNIILTPDHIKRLMVRLAKLTKKDVVLDTCTGSGGFLMEAMEIMIQLCCGNEDDIAHIQEHQLIGFEIDPVLFSLACSNMFLHGDGRTNMLFRSSLISHSEKDQKLFDEIKKLKPNKIIINPPYEKGYPMRFTEQAIDYLEDDGKLVIIMPSVTLADNISNGRFASLLEKASLDYVIKLPVSIFREQDRTVYTSIFGFTKTPHDTNSEVLFCQLNDDGLVSVQHKGRIDKNGVWNSIENNLYNAIINSKEIEGFTEKRRIIDDNGKIVFYGIKKYPKTKYELVPFGKIFDTGEKGQLQSSNSNPEGKYDFITASKEWKKHDSYDHECEAIVYVCDSEGSYGRAHYVNGKFIASNLCRILVEKDHGKYPIDMEFYTYYLNSIRDTVCKDIAMGTSKLSIRKEYLDDYKIEYIPYDEQLKLKAVIKQREIDLLSLQEQFIQKQNSFYDGISNIA